MRVKVKNIYNKSKYSFVLSVITFIIGFLFIMMSWMDQPLVRLQIGLIGFLPFLDFVEITYWTIRWNEKKKLKKILKIISVISTLILPIYYFIGLFICVLIEASNPVNDLSKYKGIVRNVGIVDVFPRDIPSGVINTRFEYSPGFLQKGTDIYLYYIDNDMNIDELTNKYSDKSIWYGKLDDYNLEEGLLKVGLFDMISVKDKDGFIIYLIEGKCDDSGYCNHGNYLLVAINEITNEVLYKFEDW